MDTYLPMSSNPGESETMIYLRDTLPSSHPETPLHHSNMIMYMNFPSSSGQYPDGLAENSGAGRSCVDIASGSNSSQQEFLLNFGGSRGGESHLNNSAWGTSGLLQGLSLSLGPHTPSVMQLSNMEYRNGDPNFTSVFGPDALMPGEDNRSKDMSFQAEDDLQNKQLSDISTTYDVSSIGRSVPDSKYLKAAQQLLDEVVNVKKASKEQNGKKELKRDAKEAERDQGDDASSLTPKASGNTITEPSGHEKKELQSKLTALLAMLDEVDRRYREYYHQMQLLVSSFDVIAGSGAAKPYTSLALHIISRQFLCLRDAINGQVHLARKSLGDEDASSSDRGIGISRLRYVDQQIRQQRTFQQLGMMQHQHSWRPQRGLPETCVSILRAWLFEHFLHPYPKDSDKIMLARQTGLTRSQVSNWFINARVRLWKPMVEEIYKEETGEVDRESNSSPETTPRATKAVTSSSETKGEEPRKGTSPTAELPLESKSDNMNTVAEITRSSTSPIFQHAGQQSICLRERTRGEDHQTCSSSLFAEGQNCGSQRFITAAAAAGRSYGVAELDRYGSMNGVSLTLGLQRCDGGTMMMTNGTSHGILPLRENSVYNSTAPAMMVETASEFDCIDSQNQPNQFVSSQLPSFT